MHFAITKILTEIRNYNFAQCVDTVGMAGMFICGFGILSRKSVAHFGLILMALSFLLSYKKLRREDIRDPLLSLSVAFLLFISIRSIFATLEYPTHKGLILEGSLKLLGTGFFLTYLFAFWMHRAKDMRNELLIVIMAGYLIQVLRNIEWNNLFNHIFRMWSGVERATFGFATNRFGLFSAVILLACLLLNRQIWGASEENGWHRSKVAFWVIICCLSAGGLIFSQSRSALIAAMLVIPAALAFKVIVSRGTKLQRLMSILLVVVLIGVGFFMFNATKILAKRLTSGIDTASVSDRLSLYEIAWANWKKNPLVGRGPGTSWLMIQQAGEEYKRLRRLDHLHNVLLDMAAQVGIVGIAFIGLSAILIIRQAFCSMHAEASDQKYVLFALGALAMMLATGIVNQPFHSPNAVYLAGYLGGICYSLKFANAVPRHQSIS